MTGERDDYEPLDLGAYGNAGPEALDKGKVIAGGLRSFHGLPFLIGGAQGSDEPRFIVLDDDHRSVRIALGRRAERVIFAHLRLSVAGGESGPSLGEQVAEYSFALDDGSSTVVPIREGFEIASAPGTWDWQAPFMAFDAGTTETLNRRRGVWDLVGLRQTEILNRFGVTELFLWAWDNPTPDVPLRSINLDTRGARILVAAITVSTAAEPPFARTAALPVRITLTGQDRPCRADELEVAVDRGVATLTYPLPDRDVERFIADPQKGWGETADPQSPHAYTRVAALPSATLTVSAAERTLARLPWRDVASSGSVERDGVRIEALEVGRSWVHVRVLDADTSRPIACRVHFSSSEGVPYQPHGHHDHVNSDLGTWHIDVGGDLRLGRLSYAYIDGVCQGWLPTGDVVVDVARGYEYEPLRTTVSIQRGQRELELRLKRWTSSNDQGWYSGDSHVHFLSAQGALTEQQAEDLNVVNLLQSQWGSLFTNTEEFTGHELATPDGRHVTFVSQENRQHVLGHMVLWGLRRPVMPWCSDGPDEAELGGALEATESDWADQCHEQGGTVVIPHFPQPNGEPATLIANGRVDAVEMIIQHPTFHREYYRYLNCGYRLPLVGGTDKMSSDVPVGLYRTYARLGDEPFSYDAWRRAVAAGRTYLSGGPLLTFQVDGHDIGDTVRISGPGTVSVSASAESIFPISTLELVLNGEVVAAATEGAGRRLVLDAEVPVAADSWLAVRCGGPGYFGALNHRDEWTRGIFAHTSPIYVTTGEEWHQFDAAQAHYMLTLIEGSLGHIRNRAVMYPEGHATHHHGLADHQAYLERPFLEARARLERRLASLE